MRHNETFRALFNPVFATFPKVSLYLAVDYRKLKLVS